MSNYIFVLLLNFAFGYKCLENRWPLDFGIGHNNQDSDGDTIVSHVVPIGSDGFVVGGVSWDTNIKNAANTKSPFITRETRETKSFMRSYFWGTSIDKLDQLMVASGFIYAVMSG